MISETARFHGSFFILLFDALDDPVSVEPIPDYGVGYYLLDGKIPVYLKLSHKRKGPWNFNFFRSHQEAQKTLSAIYGECFTCLICGRDGVAGLGMDDLRQVLDGNFEEQECISVRRKLKAMYQIRGRDGVLEGRIGRQFIFEKLRAAIQKDKLT